MVDKSSIHVNSKKDEFKAAIELWVKDHSTESSMTADEIGSLDSFDRVDALRKGSILQISAYYAENKRADVSIGIIALVGMMADNDRGVCTLSQRSLSKILHRERTNVSRAVTKLVDSGKLLSMGKPGLDSILTLAIPKALACRNHIVWLAEVLAEVNMVVSTTAHPTTEPVSTTAHPGEGGCVDDGIGGVSTTAHNFTTYNFTDEEEEIVRESEHTSKLNPSDEGKEVALQGMEVLAGSESQVSGSVVEAAQRKEQQPVNHDQNDGPQPRVMITCQPLVGVCQEFPSPGSAAPLPAVRPAGGSPTLPSAVSVVTPAQVDRHLSLCHQFRLDRDFNDDELELKLIDIVDAHIGRATAQQASSALSSALAKADASCDRNYLGYLNAVLRDEVKKAILADFELDLKQQEMIALSRAKVEAEISASSQIAEKRVGAFGAAVERNTAAKAKNTAVEPVSDFDRRMKGIMGDDYDSRRPAGPDRFSEAERKIAAPFDVWISGALGNSILDRVEGASKRHVIEALMDCERANLGKKATEVQIVDWCVNHLNAELNQSGPFVEARKKAEKAAAEAAAYRASVKAKEDEREALNKRLREEGEAAFIKWQEKYPNDPDIGRTYPFKYRNVKNIRTIDGSIRDGIADVEITHVGYNEIFDIGDFNAEEIKNEFSSMCVNISGEKPLKAVAKMWEEFKEHLDMCKEFRIAAE